MADEIDEVIAAALARVLDRCGVILANVDPVGEIREGLASAGYEIVQREDMDDERFIHLTHEELMRAQCEKTAWFRRALDAIVSPEREEDRDALRREEP